MVLTWLLQSYLEPGYTEHNHFVVFNIGDTPKKIHIYIIYIYILKMFRERSLKMKENTRSCEGCMFFLPMMSFPIFDRSLPSTGMLSFGLANDGMRFSFLQVSRKSRSNLTLDFFVMDFSNCRHCRAVSFPCFSRILLKMFRERSLKMKENTRSCEGCMFFLRYFDHHCDRPQDDLHCPKIQKGILSHYLVKIN